MLNQIDYYFDEQCIYDCFNACKNALWRNLNSEKAMQLDSLVKIHEVSESNKNDDYENAIVVDISNLQELMKTIINEFYDDSEIAGLFMNVDYIREKIETAIRDQSKLNCAITLERNSDLTMLFTLYFAQSISTTRYDLENELQYEDFDYSEFIDMIESELENNPSIDSFEKCNVGGEVQSEQEYIDIYYQITLK